jgi:phosphoribosylglycinamide formyltransferase-1
MDTGPVILQEAVPVLAGDTAATLHARIQQVEHRLYPAAIAEVARSL